MKIGLRCWCEASFFVSCTNRTGFWSNCDTETLATAEIAGIVWLDSIVCASEKLLGHGDYKSEGDFIQAVRDWLSVPGNPDIAAERFGIEWQEFPGLGTSELVPGEFDDPEYLYRENGELL